VAQEHRAVRERAALIDQSSFTKFEISGPGAFTALQRIAANDLAKPAGAVTYTQLCNTRGGIEADVTIVRLAEDRFYLVTGSGFGIRDSHWIAMHLPRDGSVFMQDVTSARAVINLCGPLARHVLERASDDDVSNAAFPYLHAREIRIGYAPVLAVRITYVGELGWELHVPTEYAQHVYERLWEIGRICDIANAGYRAIETLRLEKRYLYWGADISPDYNPYEAGLGFCVALNKGDFIGRDALCRIKTEGPRRRLCCFLLQQAAPVYGGEAIRRGNRVLGVTSSGGFGHTIGRSIVFGYVAAEEAGHSDYEIEAFGKVVPAIRSLGAPYDPERKRILA
jgi:sarcosine dehydrogenase